MSALPPKADIVQHGGNVRFVPNFDQRAAQKIERPPRLGGLPAHWTVGLYFNAVETDWNVVFRLVPRARTMALSPMRLAEEFEDRPRDPCSDPRNTTIVIVAMPKTQPASRAHAIVARMPSISANASFFSDGVMSEAWTPLRTIVTISSRPSPNASDTAR